MTPFVRSTMKWMSEANLDVADLYWFDISGVNRKSDVDSQYLLECRPPFEKNMVVYQGKTQNHPLYEVLMMVVGTDPEEGIMVSIWKGAHGRMPRRLPMMVYLIDGEQIRYGQADDEDSNQITKEEAELMLAYVASWYQSLIANPQAYVPVVKPTFTNKRKIAQGKKPLYDWTTVSIEPRSVRNEPQGGTHASPRLHDRRGHLRRLKSGKNVWVKACKVGKAELGTVFHDYEVKT